MYAIVYLTCEVKARDLDSRMLIAAHLLKRGYPVVIGQQWAMTGNRTTSFPGCMLFKTVNLFQGQQMAAFREAGYAIAATDEESLPFAGEGFLVNIDPHAMSQTDIFLAHTEAQRNILLAKYPDLSIRVTGSPRIDLLRAEKPARPLAEPYILFNTNFALTNSLWGDPQTAVNSLIAGGGLDPKTEAGRAEIQTRHDFEVKTRKEMTALIRWCADNLPLVSVVRPHPAENAVTWNSMAGKSLRIVAGSAPLPWIANAKIVVHANSTTGLEAAILGVPCLNISPPKYDPWVAQFVMRGLNPTVANAQTGAERIVEFLKSGEGLTHGTATAHFPSGGAERTADTIIDLLTDRNAAAPDRPVDWQKFQRTDVQRAKFTATPDEFANALTQAARGLHLPQIHIQELDDSVVLLSAA